MARFASSWLQHVDCGDYCKIRCTIRWSGRTERATENGVGQAASGRHSPLRQHSSVASSPISVHQGQWWTFWASSLTFIVVLFVIFCCRCWRHEQSRAICRNVLAYCHFWCCDVVTWTAATVIGRQQNTATTERVTADTLDQHYAPISSDSGFDEPQYRHTAACEDMDVVSEWQVFKLLDALPATATGLDLLPFWFLRKGAPFFYKPITPLFGKCILTFTVPHQWKKAWIKPVPKTATPHQNSDYRPISITPVLSRILDASLTGILYPAIASLPVSLEFTDQYAFRPTGSTTAVLVAILHSITDEQISDRVNLYVVVLAFDTVRHVTLLQKIALLWLSRFCV